MSGFCVDNGREGKACCERMKGAKIQRDTECPTRSISSSVIIFDETVLFLVVPRIRLRELRIALPNWDQSKV